MTHIRSISKIIRLIAMREIEYGAFFHCTGLDRDTESKIDQLTHHAPKQSVPKQPSTLTADMRGRDRSRYRLCT